ncbi:MAG: transcriptional regulator GutM [Selenomonadaceae bacterium]|nr:transcriptional regulator GutM [Selenomonadaceae bacterium]
MGYFIALAVVVWIAQTALGFWQFKKFNRHLKDLRKLGRVSIGRARGYFASGVLVLFIIDDDCRIIRGEIMEGRTVFAGFKPFNHFNGLTLFELSENLCKSMKLSKQQTSAVISAQKEYESYKLMKTEENLAVSG